MTLQALGPAASEARAEEEILRVPTTWRTHDEHASRAAGAPGDLLADVRATGTLDLTVAPPAGTGAVPPGRLRYGTLEIGSRRLRVALGRTQGDGAVMAVDLDGDGNLRGAGEVVTAAGRAGRSDGRATLRWKFPTQRLGALVLDVSFRQLARTFQAVQIAATPAPLELAEAPPAGCRPVRVEGYVRYATVETAQGARGVAFVRGDGDRLTLLVDRDGNGAVGEAGEVLAAPVQAREAEETFWQTAEMEIGGTMMAFAYKEVQARAQAGWSTRAVGARRGTVTVGGEPYQLHLLDADFDGTWTSAGDFWWFGPAPWLERFTQLLPISMVEARVPFPLTPAWRLISVDAEGNAIVGVDRQATSCDAYFHERTERVNRTQWFPAFQGDTAFEQKWQVDARRAKAASPPRWHHGTSVAAALALARAEGKPVLVDFEADWCSICKRWDYHVYADAEVAGLLQQFVLFKINVDFNFSKDVAAYGGKNPPYLVFLGTDGKPLLSFPQVDKQLQPTGRTIAGLAYFQRPADFVGTLRAALDANDDE
jgi:thiol-disulfide isomerase/thioredoxin